MKTEDIANIISTLFDPGTDLRDYYQSLKTLIDEFKRICAQPGQNKIDELRVIIEKQRKMLLKRPISTFLRVLEVTEDGPNLAVKITGMSKEQLLQLAKDGYITVMGAID